MYGDTRISEGLSDGVMLGTRQVKIHRCQHLHGVGML
jgi:hypothetical protein